MRLDQYRQVFALPRVGTLILVALFARVPVTCFGLALTLHVVIDLKKGYGAAGVVGAASTIGVAVGAPLVGRLVDRRGLRPTLVVTGVAEAVFWAVAPSLPYPLLVAAGFISGLLALPVFSVVRQSLAALVPEERRRPAYAIDSMSVELSFMAGPPLAVLVVTTASPTAAMYAVGAAMVLGGVAFYLLDPPVRSPEEEAATTGARPPLRRWLTPGILAVLVAATSSTMVLAGTDMAIVATLRQAGQVEWIGMVLAAWGAYSLLGGFVHGAVRRSLPLLGLVALLGLFTLPVGLADRWWLLCLALVPAGALCAPSLAATGEAISKLVPAAVRGEAMGLQGSALTLGFALGAPLAGAVVDAKGPAWGFVVAGAAGLIGAAAVAVARRPLPALSRV